MEKPGGNPHEKYRGVPKRDVLGVGKGGVIKRCDKRASAYFISEMQKFCILQQIYYKKF